MVDKIDDDLDFGIQWMMLPTETDQKYCIHLTEDEVIRALGRAALDKLLNQARVKFNVVVISDDSSLETDVEDVEKVAQSIIAPEVESNVKTAAPVTPKQTKEQIEQMMQSYREQLRLISQTIAQEKQLLKTQEHIRLLQELNRSNLPSLTDDAKVDLMKRIAEYEKQIVEIEAKLAELQSALQDIVI